MILLIDNYDSFVHNLARYLRRLGQETDVVRNDAVTVDDIRQLRPQAIVMSPGPCAPQQAGCCLDVIRELHTTIPMLGVCLGHQAIAQALGGEVVRANEPVHGQASLIAHNNGGTFAGLPKRFLVGRYHSLVVKRDSLPTCFEVQAWLPDRTIMAVEHKTYPIVGWQFHPESVLTEHGYGLLNAFLVKAGAVEVANENLATTELRRAIPDQPDWFERAIEYPGRAR